MSAPSFQDKDSGCGLKDSSRVKIRVAAEKSKHKAEHTTKEKTHTEKETSKAKKKKHANKCKSCREKNESLPIIIYTFEQNTSLH